MPYEIAELAGQPLIGWDMCKVLQHDGSEILIDRVISIHDICPMLRQGVQGIEQACLCFFATQKQGPSVVFLMVRGDDYYLLPVGDNLSAVAIKSIRDMNEQGGQFLRLINQRYGAQISELFALITA